MSEEVQQVVERNEPIHTDGRATEQSVQDRIEAKIFGKPEKPEVKPDPQAEPAETPKDAQDTVEGAQAEEEIDLEWQGTQYKVPKDWKPVFDGYKDYTQKTMAAADRQKHADLIIEQARQAAAMQQVVQPKQEALGDVRKMIKQFDQVDWNTWIATNPVEAQKGMLQLQALQNQERKAKEDLDLAMNEQLELINQTRAKLKEENEKVLGRKIKGWTADTAKKLDTFAGKTYGFSEQELSQVYDSRVREMMHDAMQWHTLQASKPQMQKVVAQAKTMKPEGSEQKNAAQVKQSGIRREIRSAKTDHEKAKGIQRLLESRFS